MRRPLASGPIKMVTYRDSSPESEGEAAGESGGNRATKVYWVPGRGKKSETWLAYEAVQDRIRNLEAVEMGRWNELEKPRRREKVRAVAALACAGLLVVAAILAPFVPWQGKSLWYHATNNALWKALGW